MSNFGVFDVIGPIMIGPSSSHTAGAAKLGQIAKTIVGEKIKEVTFLLHGSFGRTYKGHGTDKALVAGILGMSPSDSELKNSIQIAKDRGLKINFIEQDFEQAHPNTVKFLIKDIKDNIVEIVGSSIGGGSVEINEINGDKMNITCEYPTIITCHDDIPGTVARVADLLYENEINIAFMKLTRGEKGKSATMNLEIDSCVSDSLVNDIKKIKGMKKVIVINL